MKTRPNRTPHKQSQQPVKTSITSTTPSSSPARTARTSRPAAGGLPFAINLRALLPGAALLLLALLVYLPALRAGFIWDDDALTQNPLVADPSGLGKIWFAPGQMPGEQHYWPLVYSTFWLEYRLAGLAPFLYHLNNILLHGAACVLLWRLLRRLALPGAWLAAALFAVHPVHAESVAWVIERKDVLSGVFYFAAALAFLRFHETPDTAPQNRRWRAYALALSLFAAALLSKSIAVTLPVALALILWLRHGRLTRRDLAPILPLLALAAALTVLDLYHVKTQQQPGFEASGLAFPERLQVAGRALWVYLGKLAWPHPLAPFYPKWPVGRAHLAAWLPLLAWALLLAGLWLARHPLGRGPAAALAFFALTLAPALGLLDFEFLSFSWVADRFQYLASAGPLALAAAGLAALAQRLRLPWRPQYCAAAALLAVPGLLCLRQAALYHDSVRLFQHAAAAYPQCWPAQVNLGWALAEAGRPGEAIAALEAGLHQTGPEPHLAHALARNMDQAQRFPEAERYYQETLRLNPGFTAARVNYGAFLGQRGRMEEAAAQFREELLRHPNNLVAQENLAIAQQALTAPPPPAP